MYWERGPKAHLRITCPHGHVIPCNSEVLEGDAGFVRCTAYTGGGPRRHDCDEWVFVKRFRGGGVMVASVSREEKDALSKLTHAEIIDALGIFDQLKRGA
jgi:hypothetical protein